MIKQWLTRHLRNEDQHKEVDSRVQRSDAVVEELRQQREKNGFGAIFDAALQPKGGRS